MKQKNKLFAALAVFALLLTSCSSDGGSDDTSNTSTSAPTSETSKTSDSTSEVPSTSQSSSSASTSIPTPTTSSSSSSQTSVPTSSSTSEQIIAHYTVTWNIDGNTKTEDYAYGDTPVYKDGTPTKPEDAQYSYSFEGWNPTISQVTGNATYEAVFSSSLEKAKIIFDLNGGTSSSSTSPIYKSSINSTGFFFDCIKEGWNFRGWSYNGVKVFDEKGIQLSNPPIADTMTFVAMYSQTAKMTIVSNLENAGNITGEGEYPYNTYVDVSAHPNQGYVFDGWYYQDTLLSNTEDYKYMMWSEDIVLEVRFNLDSYSLNIHTNNENYGLVLLKSSYCNDYLTQHQDYIDFTSQVTIAAYSKTNVRFLGWYNSNNELVSANAVYSFVMPNYDYTLEAKWNYFTVSYNLDGGTNNPSNPTYYTIDSDGITLYTPFRVGYEFIGWTYNGKIIVKIDVAWVSDITLTANWKDKNMIKPSLLDDNKTVTYGLYPQKVISDCSLISSLNALVTPEPNGWYLYEGNYYAKTNGKPFNSFSRFSNGESVKGGEIYWFMCTPIVWNVLSDDNGEYLLLSSVLLDAHRYNESYSGKKDYWYYANNYYRSEIRTWLNNDFYSTAFILDDSHIQTTTVDNSAVTTDNLTNNYACSNTEDKVLLLSYCDYVNESYGFSDAIDADASRECRLTDWALARGARSFENHTGIYWTRSPYSNSGGVVMWVVCDDELCYATQEVGRKEFCIRPAITIKL